MMNPNRALVGVATVLVGLAAGFFYAYQFSVTRGLAEVDDATYVTTFRAINETIGNPGFAIVFFGSVVALVAALVVGWRSSGAARWLLLAALVLYLAGIGVTGVGNVPLNDALAAESIGSAADQARARSDFESDWNRLNLVRTVACTASFACLVAMSALKGDRRKHAEPTDAARAVAPAG